MAADMQKLMRSKESILNSITTRGPSLPIQIARGANLTLLFASAYLSELYNERKVKMTSMKVGSSSLYYMNGQEQKLENFVEHLNHKEREAFTRLKTEKILEDDKMEPAIRVALRAIKDFALPVRINLGEESKLFWKYYLLTDEELKDIAQEKLSPKKAKKEERKDIEEKQDKQNTLKEEEKEDNKIDTKIKPEKIGLPSNNKIDEIKLKIEELKKEADAIKEENKIEIKEKKKKILEESKFIKDVKEYLKLKNVEILNIIDEKKNNFVARVEINMVFGKQEFYLIAKDKKKITEEDIIISLQKAGEEKMPALIISPGEIDKKSLDYAKNYRNLVKFEKLKL